MFLWADASDLDHLPCYARFLECAQVRGQGESACAISVGQARQARRHGRRSTLRINAEVSRACVQAYARVAVITILLSLDPTNTPARSRVRMAIADGKLHPCCRRVRLRLHFFNA